MNHDEEKRLQGVALRAPSQALDARMERLFAAPAVYRPRLLARPVLAWQCALICILCTTAAFLAGSLTRGKETGASVSPEVRYVIQIEQQAFDVFDWTKYPKRSAPCSLLRTQNKTPERAGKS